MTGQGRSLEFSAPILGGKSMQRFMVVALVAMCLIVSAGVQGFASEVSDKVKAANERAAQDYLKSGFILAGEGRDADAVQAFRQALSIKPN